MKWVRKRIRSRKESKTIPAHGSNVTELSIDKVCKFYDNYGNNKMKVSSNSFLPSSLVLLIIVIGATEPSLAKDKKQESDPALLTLDRIFLDREFSVEPASIAWLGKSHEYTKETDEGIMRYSAGSREGKLLVPMEDLIPPGETSPLEIDGLSWSDDESLLIIYTNSQQVWRTKSRGDYWVLDRGSRELRKLGGEKAKPSSMSFARVSPDNRHVAYVRERNIFIENLIDHSIRKLTKTSTEFIINGTFDWVYEEELGLRNGFRWSPDGKSIAYWQLDCEGVRDFTMVDNVSGLYPKLTTFPYPKVGQKNSAARIGVVPIATGKTQWLDIPGDPREHYLAKLEWLRKDSQQVVIQKLNRLQNKNFIMIGNAETGEVRTILTERDKAWVDVHDEMFWIEKGEQFTWISERDGWRHIYFAATSGGAEPVQITKGNFDVIELLSVDQRRKKLYFSASPANPAERYLYSVDFTGKNLTRVTPAAEARGTHAYSISPDARYAMVTSSNFDNPPVSKIVSLPDHKKLQIFKRNKKLRKKFEKLNRGESEFSYIDIGNNVLLHARSIRPPDFDPDKKYPMLIYVYGEPAGQTVRDSWGGDITMWHDYLAQQGVVIMTIDNRGTASPRGRDFRKSVYRKVGTLGPNDQAEALKVILKERPYLDPERVGIWGWSGGGSSSLHAIFRYPDLYKTAISVAAVPNQRGYDTIYQERYMGLPGDNVKGYRAGSAINFAKQLKGDLLIIHGTADDNCHYATYEKLVNQLINNNKQFTMMAYPNRAHGIKEGGKNTKRHLFKMMTDYLDRNLIEISDTKEDVE